MAFMATVEERRSALERELGIEGIDPTTFSVLIRRYIAIVDEMTAALENAAWTSILALARDFSCAVFDGHTRLIAMHEGAPLHISGMHVVLEEIAHRFEGKIGDGDVMICNDPYSGNSHVGDVVIAAPVFADGELCFWSAVKVHHLDIGAPWPTSMPYLATDVWTEGLTMPPLKIYDGGEFREDVFAMILANLRYPDQLLGDLLAQQGAVQVGKRGLLRVVDRYGLETVKRYTEGFRLYAYKRAGAEIETWPDGTYVGESWLDSDGHGTTDIYVRATVTIEGDKVHIDLTGSDRQAPGAVNSSFANSVAACVLPVLECLDPDIPPHNRGCQDHVVINPGPKGTVTNCRWPGSTAVDTALSGDCIQEAVWKALAQAIPDKVIGGVAKSPAVAFVSGVDRRFAEETAWGMAIFNSSGGGGASKGHDGWHQFVCYGCMGCLKCSSIEMMELLYPVLFEQLEIEPMSGGAGQWVGGPGIRTILRPHGGFVDIYITGEGMLNPPHGAVGGEPGCGGGTWHQRADGTRTFHGSKAHIPLEDGERWFCVSSGAGGYGRPIDRDPERVAADVRDELVSASLAHDVYGVVPSEDGAVDEAATASRRAELEATTVYEVTKPNHPRAATWLEREMREGEVFLQDSL
jgi:N-methylhydantoinase B